jgi:hypothetical protein
MQQNGGGNNSHNNGGGNNGRNGSNNGRHCLPRYQLYGNWGHEAMDFRNQFNQDYYPKHPGSSNKALTTNTEALHCLMDRCN